MIAENDADRAARRMMSLRLVGELVCFVHQPEGPKYFCDAMSDEGMVHIEGMVGYFAPHLFVVAKEEHA